MNRTEYNGWTNYETWQCNMYLFDGMSKEDTDCSTVDECTDWVRSFVESYIDDVTENPNSLISDILYAWLREVDYEQIAQNLMTD